MESIDKMRGYLLNASLSVKITKDLAGKTVIAKGSCKPFKNASFDFKIDKGSGIRNKLCQV